jgi:anti-sigma factor RsiW
VTHEEVANRLQDYHFGDLPDAERAEVEAHLSACDECGGLSRAYRVLHSVLRHDEPGAAAAHPTAEELVRFAVEEQATDVELRDRIEGHLASCSTCREDVESTRRTERRLASGPREATAAIPAPSAASAWSRWGALAAGLLVLALLYPAYLGLVRLPRQQRAHGDARQVTAWSGSLELNLLSSALRDLAGGEAPVVRITGPFVAFGVDMTIPRSLGAEDILRFSMTREDGTTVAKIEASVADAREQIRESGVVTLLLDSAALEPGAHQLRVTTPEESADRPLLEVPFEVQPID